MHQGINYFINDSVFMLGYWEHNELIHSSEECKTLTFSLGIKSLPVCIGCHIICIPVNSKYGAYVL